MDDQTPQRVDDQVVLHARDLKIARELGTGIVLLRARRKYLHYYDGICDNHRIVINARPAVHDRIRLEDGRIVDANGHSVWKNVAGQFGALNPIFERTRYGMFGIGVPGPLGRHRDRLPVDKLEPPPRLSLSPDQELVDRHAFEWCGSHVAILGASASGIQLAWSARRRSGHH
jgi:hypothetical protein